MKFYVNQMSVIECPATGGFAEINNIVCEKCAPKKGSGAWNRNSFRSATKAEAKAAKCNCGATLAKK